jgi:hypothetical protein
VCVNEPGAGRPKVNVSIANVGLAFAEGFHLSAMEDQPGLMSLKNMVVIGGGAVLCDDLLARLSGFISLFRRLGHN